MPRARVQITTEDPETGRQSVRIDGALVPGVAEVTVNMRALEMATVEVRLAVWELEVDGEMQYEVPEKTRAGLVMLGWTPPAEPEDEPTIGA